MRAIKNGNLNLQAVSIFKIVHDCVEIEEKRDVHIKVLNFLCPEIKCL